MKKIFMAAAIAVAALFCSSCIISMDDEYDYAEGGAILNMSIEEIDIDWIAGNVVVRYHDKPYFEFYDDASSRPMCYNLTGDRRLYLRHDRRIRVGLSSCERKTLYLYLPSECLLDSFTCETVSANIDVDADSRIVDIETVSGDVYYSTLITTKMIDIETVSGNVTIALPEATAFSLDFDTTSGGIRSEYPLTPADGYMWYGIGGTNINVDTVSGNLDIIVNRN